MASEVNINLVDIFQSCRICMEWNSEMKPLFTAGDNSLVDKVKFCTGLQLTNGGGFPSHICSRCVENLSTAYTFKTACLNSDITFRKLLGKVKEEPQDLPFETIDLISKCDIKTEAAKETKNPDEAELKSILDMLKQNGNISIKMPSLPPKREGTRGPRGSYKSKKAKFTRVKKHTSKVTSKNKVTKKAKSRKLSEAVIEISDDNVDENYDDVNDDAVFDIKNDETEEKRSVLANKSDKTNKKPVLDDYDAKLDDDFFYASDVDMKKVWEAYKLKNGMQSKKRKKPRKRKTVKKNKRDLYCDVSDVQYKEKEKISEHKKTHESQHICEICGKTFARLATLMSHILYHREPIYKCDQCDYATPVRRDLVKHMRSHSGDKTKPFQCQFCPKHYRTVSSLNTHIYSIHEQRRPNKCNLCPMAFFDRTKLQRHLDSHYKTKRHHCEHCNGSFSRRYQWKAHLLKFHGVTIPTLRPGRMNLYKKSLELVNKFGNSSDFGTTEKLDEAVVASTVDNCESGDKTVRNVEENYESIL